MKKIKWSLWLSTLVENATLWAISAAFIMWGWNTLAPHINCPTFGYWEIFAMRMGLSHVVQIFTKSITLIKKKGE